MTVTLGNVTDEIRHDIKVELARRGWNQNDLAAELGISKAHMSAILTGKSGNLPKTYRAILDKLDLRLIAVPKEARVTVSYEE